MAAKSAKTRDADKQWVASICRCGAGGGQYLGHWELLLCRCQKMYWALQPERGGPLVLFPWPGQVFR